MIPVKNRLRSAGNRPGPQPRQHQTLYRVAPQSSQKGFAFDKGSSMAGIRACVTLLHCPAPFVKTHPEARPSVHPWSKRFLIHFCAKSPDKT